ncbi:MAG: gluconate 2-dehydrogenase subunit 3 family protein [Pyrinomonadaceae bacterium]
MPSRIYPSGTVRALLETEFVTPLTREVLRSRLAPPDAADAPPRFFDAETFATLRAACARLIPQPERAHSVDLAGSIDARLAGNMSDGWRYNTMPPDRESYRLGIRGLDESAQAMFGHSFQELDAPSQERLLLAVQRGEVMGESWQRVSAQRFFEELLAEVTECYYSDPLAQEEIGYVGTADAAGWHKIGLDVLEEREPRSLEEIK